MIRTDTVESFLRVNDVYRHCGAQHFPPYAPECDFRYSNRSNLRMGDNGRAEICLRGIAGQRLKCRRFGPVAAWYPTPRRKPVFKGGAYSMRWTNKRVDSSRKWEGYSKRAA